MIEELHFLRPLWLLGVIPALALAIVWVRRRTSGSHWEDAVAPELLTVLLESTAKSRAQRAVWGLVFGLAVGTVGLAGPTWERLPQPVEQKNDALVILFDLSLSMFAEDVSPSRLVRARHKIVDVLRLREEGVTALVAFAGDAHTVVPLTDDTRTIENLLLALSPEMMPVLGSNTRSAMEVAHELFENAHIEQGRILLVTDAVDRINDVIDFSNPRFPVSLLGVGTSQGAPIPLDFVNQPGRVLQTQQGETIRAVLDEDRLRSIASITHGRYRTLVVDDGDIAHLMATPLPQEDASIEIDRDFDTWADAGYWIALLLIPFMLVGFRRVILASVCLCILPVPAQAGLWDDLWQRRDQQGRVALLDGQPDTAAVLFEDSKWRAAAKYRSEDYQGAAEDYSVAEVADDHYNLANSLAQLGEYQAAINAYDRAIAMVPIHDDAVFNKALVEKLLQQQQEASEQDNNQQQNQGGNNPDDARQSQNDESQQDQQNNEDQQAQSQNQEQSDEQNQQTDADDSQQQMQAQNDQRSRDEKQEALEQWLRRVPDDPGGLLRRKFQYETNQRLRRGNYRDREQEKIW